MNKKEIGLMKDVVEHLFEDCCECHYYTKEGSPYKQMKSDDCRFCDNSNLQDRIQKMIGQEYGFGGWNDVKL